MFIREKLDFNVKHTLTGNLAPRWRTAVLSIIQTCYCTCAKDLVALIACVYYGRTTSDGSSVWLRGAKSYGWWVATLADTYIHSQKLFKWQFGLYKKIAILRKCVISNIAAKRKMFDSSKDWIWILLISLANTKIFYCYYIWQDIYSNKEKLN